MYNIKILTRAYFSLIKLVDSYSSADWQTLSNLYHLVKLVRRAMRDFPQYAVCLDEFKSVLDISATQLKKRVGKRLNQYFIKETTIGSSTNDDKGGKKRILHSPLNDLYGAIVFFIRRAAENRKISDFLLLHRIADLYMQHFFVYSDMIDENPDIDASGEINISLCVIIHNMGHYIGLIECLMRTEGIKFDEIKV